MPNKCHNPEWEQGNILKDITYLELIPIALSVYLWGNQWHGKKILFQFSKNIFHVNISLCIAFVIFIKW
jgi:hypothetical protein